MSATNRHRRLFVTAAGLAMSGALMVACGHARGERAMNGSTTDTAAVSTPTPAESLSAATPVNPSATAAAPSSSTGAAGSNATAPTTATTTATARHHARKARAESTDYSSSAVPDQTASTTTPKARRHRGAAETSNAGTSNAETASTEAAKTDTTSAASNTESASSGLAVSGANAMPVGATCTAASSPGYEASYTTAPSTPANVTASTGAQTAKDAHAGQPYDINRPADATSLSKTPTNTPDTVGGSLGRRDSASVQRDTSKLANATAMAPTTPSSETATPSSSVSSISAAGTLPPCGWPTGAKGTFLNDAQVADAAIIANSVDSSISANIAAKTQNAAVREYAQMMVRDHTEANQQMASLVDRTRIAPAENDIADGILHDTTGHTFTAPSSTVMLTVPGHVVTPVTQPQTQPSKTNVPAAPKPAHIDTLEAPAMGGTGSNPAVKSTDSHVNVYDYNSPSSTTTKPDTTKVTASITAPTTASVTASAPASTTVSQPLTGDDKNYIDFMVQAHQQLLDALDNRLIPFAWNPDLKSALTAMRPVVQRHLDRARELQRGQTTTSQY